MLKINKLTLFFENVQILLAILSNTNYICLSNLADMVNYGDYFKALRESLGFTLREVERQADVSNAYLSQLESGKIRQPSPLTLHKLAEVYKIPYEVLMEKVGYPTMSNSSSEIANRQSEVAFKMGEITEDEEMELLNYLAFIRNRKK